MRLSKRERQARLAFRGSRADLVRDNQAATKRPQTAGLEREFRLLSGVGKLGAGYLAPAMLKGHSLSKGCGASGAGRGAKAKPKRETFDRWSEGEDVGPNLPQQTANTGKRKLTVGAANAGLMSLLLPKAKA